MKTLLLNGSPKRGASDTLILANAFLDGMGAEFERVDVIGQKIAPCLGCFSCWQKTPGVCAIRDDAGPLLERIVRAELVVWSMPLYCYGMPSHVKALVDRLLPLATPRQYVDAEGRTHHPARHDSRARHLLISGSGFPDYEGNFDGLVFQFRRLFGADAPAILCAETPLLNIPEAREATLPLLGAVRRAGAEFAQAGGISEETMAQTRVPMIEPDLYRRICSGEA